MASRKELFVHHKTFEIKNKELHAMEHTINRLSKSIKSLNIKMGSKSSSDNDEDENLENILDSSKVQDLRAPGMRNDQGKGVNKRNKDVEHQLKEHMINHGLLGKASCLND